MGVEPGGHRRMVDRRERRALASRLDVGRTEVRDEIEAERGRCARAVTELARQAEARPMQDGLAVQADQRDPLAGDREPVEERLDRGDMGVVTSRSSSSWGAWASFRSATTARRRWATGLG